LRSNSEDKSGFFGFGGGGRTRNINDIISEVRQKVTTQEPVVYSAPQAGGYHVIKRMQVGGDGGWDYLLIDPPTHRLYIARGSHFQVVDVTRGKVIGDIAIANSMNSHGIALATDLGKGFTSNGEANTVSVVDLKTLKATSVIDIPGKNRIRSATMPAPRRCLRLTARAWIRP